MSTTNAAESETTTSMTAIRRAVLGLVMVVAVLGSGVPLAGAAEKTPIPRPEPCLNILTCKTGQLPPGKVDPGPRPRPPALPAPNVVFEGREAYMVGSKRFVLHSLDVTNWQSYHPSLFTRVPGLPSCSGTGTGTWSRTRVDIYSAVSDRRITGFCAMDEPQHLRSIRFALKSGEHAPHGIYVRLTDHQTGRVVTSNSVRIPPMSQVTARYTAAENANIDVAARHWGIHQSQVQKQGVMAIRYIHGVAGTTGADPLRPRPEVSGPVSYTSLWKPADQDIVAWVSDYYDLTYAETHKLGTAVMVFFAALDQ